jgi:hypothetical protein
MEERCLSIIWKVIKYDKIQDLKPYATPQNLDKFYVADKSTQTWTDNVRQKQSIVIKEKENEMNFNLKNI